MFIHYLPLLYFSYMFRCYMHHRQGELLCPLLNIICCYVSVTNSCYSSYVVNYKMYARIGILQNTSKVLDIAHWHFLLNVFCPQKRDCRFSHRTPSFKTPINSTVDRCSAQARAFEFLYCTRTVPLSPLAMFIYSQKYPFLIGWPKGIHFNGAC